MSFGIWRQPNCTFTWTCICNCNIGCHLAGEKPIVASAFGCLRLAIINNILFLWHSVFTLYLYWCCICICTGWHLWAEKGQRVLWHLSPTWVLAKISLTLASIGIKRHSVFMIIFVSILYSYWFNKFGFHWSLICFSCYVSSGTQKLKAQLWRFCLQTLESRVISKYSWCIDASYCTANCDDKAVVETGWTTCRNLGNTWRDAALSTIDNPSIGILARAGFQGKQPSAKFPADFEVVDKHSQLNFQKILIVKHKNMLFSRVFSLLNIPF